MELAKKTKLSQSFLSQLERGITSASINSLRKIAQAIGCPMGTFFEEPEQTRGPIVRKQERRLLHNTKSKLTYQLLANNPRIQLLLTILEPGASTLETPMGHQGDEAGLILQGGCSCELGDETFEMNEGDAILIPEGTPHRFTNTGSLLMVAVSAISPPGF